MLSFDLTSFAFSIHHETNVSDPLFHQKGLAAPLIRPMSVCNHRHGSTEGMKRTDLEPEPKIKQQQKTKTNRIKWSEAIAHKMSHTSPKLFWFLFLDPIGYEEAMFQKKHKFFGAKRTQTRQD